MKHLRAATANDFKVGNTLITPEGYGFCITSKYDNGVWEARGTEGQGDKCLFESEACFYKVEDKPPCCPDCSGKIKFIQTLKTGWYGELKYYWCKACNETFVSQNGGELEIAAK